MKQGDHFWALVKNAKQPLMVVMALGSSMQDGFEVCGAWECGIGGQDIELVQKIERPSGHESTGLYYLFGEDGEEEGA